MSIDADWYRALPKIELHAHMSGSVSLECLQELWRQRVATAAASSPSAASTSSLNLPAPEVALKRGQNIASFFSHFNEYVYHLLSTPDALRFAIRTLLREFAADGVVYLELRTTPRALAGGSEEETVSLILDEFEAWNVGTSPSPSSPSSCSGSGSGSGPMLSTGTNTNGTLRSHMQVRLLLSIDRSKHTPSDASCIIALAVRLRTLGRPVVGVDLSGNVFSPLQDYSSAFALAHSHNLPSSLHFAEVPASSSPAELETLLSYNPTRLGHVIHVPLPMRDRIVERGMTVELLPTCNVLAGMVDGYHAEHFGWWLRSAAGAGVCVGTDDVGVFGSRGSEEWGVIARQMGWGRGEVVKAVGRGVGGMFDVAEKERVRGLLEDFAMREGLEL